MLFNLNTTNGSTNPIEDIRGALTVAAIAVTTTASIALAANTGRTNYMIYNVGPNPVYLREGAAPVTATTPLYSVIIPSGFLWKEDFDTARFLGDIHVITATGTASIQVSQGVVV